MIWIQANKIQAAAWQEFDFDSIVSFKVPFEEVFMHDTIIDNAEFISWFTEQSDSSNLIIQKTTYIPHDSYEARMDFPSNMATIESKYEEYYKGITQEIQADSQVCNLTNLGRYKALSCQHFKPNSKTPFYSSTILTLDYSLYAFSYLSYHNYSQGILDSFYDNILLSQNQSISQTRGIVNTGPQLPFLCSTVSLLVIIYLVYRVRKSRKKYKLL